MAYRVLLVDDQKMQRIALEAFLKNSEDFTVAETLSAASLAPAYCRNHPVDLVVMDIVMSTGESGIEAAKRLKEEHPGIKVILVTSMPEVSYLSRAKAAGADSLWYKEYEGEPLLSVMARTMAGEHIYPDSTPALPLGNAKSSELTDGELSVLRCLVLGKTDQEIAEELFVSVWTVRTHIQHMLQKTGYKNRVELAVKARTAGLVIGE